jgi:hypothetical protein
VIQAQGRIRRSWKLKLNIPVITLHFPDLSNGTRAAYCWSSFQSEQCKNFRSCWHRCGCDSDIVSRPRPSLRSLLYSAKNRHIDTIATEGRGWRRGARVEHQYEEFVDALHTAEEARDFEQVAKRVAEQLGFRWFAYLYLAGETRALLSSYPKCWKAIFRCEFRKC